MSKTKKAFPLSPDRVERRKCRHYRFDRAMLRDRDTNRNVREYLGGRDAIQ